MTDDLVKRLRAQIGDGHAKGCDGRSYNCDCGFDLATEGLLDLAASALESLTAENAALRKIIGECASALPNGAMVGPDASLDFMKMLPGEIGSVCATLLQQRNEAFKRAASWHDHQAELVMNLLHCGDGVPTIAAARRKSDWHTECAAALRNLSKES